MNEPGPTFRVFLTHGPTFVLLLACAGPAMGAVGESHPDGMGHAPEHTGMEESTREWQEGSGTAWQPADSPVYAHHFPAKPWDLMAHYNAFLAYNHQEGPRGDDQWSSINWAMLMGRRPLGEGELTLRGMVSLERATTGGDGYPLLFQSGESWNDKPLVDRQHPHDLFMELAARYDHPIAEAVDGFLYLAPAGEPALGPVAYPHRASAIEFPLAPLGHHWQDSSHITFGVITAGLYNQRWQAEASGFTGREPDENRWDLDPIRIDSWSGRLTHNWSRRWSASGSYGVLHEPEPLHPDVDVERKVLAISYGESLGALDRLDATAVWGRNSAEGRDLDSHLLEGTLTRDRHHFFLRWETVVKTGEELLLTPANEEHRITAQTFGYVYDVHRGSEVVGIGASFTAYATYPMDDGSYGDNPWSSLIYLRVRPSATAPHSTP
jgi:hypothetical protein